MIYDADNNVLTSLSLSLESTVVRVYTIKIDCFTGNFLSGEAVADAAIEARHGVAGAYTDIETTPIDLTPWAGSLETFQIRVTAGTVTAHLTRAFQLRVGLPI